MPKKKLADLNKLILESETADKFLFSEQRSNVLLVAGEHYTRKNSRYWNRLRESRYLDTEQKLRLTKNHLRKITNAYVNEIVSHAPGVVAVPNNEKEIQDRKSSELNQSVLQFAKKRYKLKEKVRQFAHDFIEIGEVASKIIWDPKKGDHIGYEQKVDPTTGEPMFEPFVQDPMTGQMLNTMGEPISAPEPMADEEKPIFSGDFIIKRVFGFNLRRPSGCQDMDSAPWLGEVELLPIEEVKEWVAGDEAKVKKISERSDSKYYVFDGNLTGYENKKGYVPVYSIFYKPCHEYPNGYYYIFTEEVEIFQGELPFGVYPLIYGGFDQIQTSPRHRSIIKQLRPYQIEINRCASKIAEHQVTLGDDKLLIQSGTKITNGVSLPGVRSMTYTGKEPTVLNGRSGAQYLDYMGNQISEMYEVANVVEEQQAKVSQGEDPFGQLFKSMRNKKKFSLYAEKFEQFLLEFYETFLKLAKNYYDENFLIPMVGRNEAINISEFKNTDPLSYQITLEPRTEDIETLYGKQLTINHALQYVGNQLDKGDIGRLMRAMPFGNFEEGFEDLTMDYDLANNLILALDRGDQPEPSPYDDTTYVLKRLVSRIRQPDFKYLDPMIQQNYLQYKQMYEQIEVTNQRKILAANADYIPTGGAKVKVDFYVPKPGDPEKSERATLPAEAINWLVERLADQGSSQERLAQLTDGQLADMAGQLTAGLEGQGQVPLGPNI